MSDRALCVGINAYPDAPLQGCINDVTDMAEFLTETYDFHPDSIRMLTDKRATTKAILERVQWLVADAKPGDRILFHFSGHGVQIPTRNKKAEVDGLDECLCPVDFDWEQNVIRDDELIAAFAKLPAGVKAMWFSDSCHSGDLSRDLLPPGLREKTMRPPADIAWRFRSLQHTGFVAPTKDTAMIKKGGSLPVVFVSGCRSNQTSADAHFKNRANGALTYFLLKALSAPHGTRESMATIVKSVRAALRRENFSQVPQLEGEKVRFDKPFFG